MDDVRIIPVKQEIPTVGERDGMMLTTNNTELNANVYQAISGTSLSKLSRDDSVNIGFS